MLNQLNMGQQIKFWRQKKKLSQLKLANKLQMNQCQISKIEKNERKVLAQELLVIAQALEVPLETLLTQSSTNPN